MYECHATWKPEPITIKFYVRIPTMDVETIKFKTEIKKSKYLK